MTDPGYAAWVKPIASVLVADRRAVTAFARSLPAAAWDEPSDVEGWTRKDILAHLAGGNDQMVQTILRAVTAHEPLDDLDLPPDTDAENAVRIEKRRSWGVADVIAELERDGDEVAGLLSRLTNEDEGLFIAGLSMTLGQFLRIVEHERHDAEHLQQMS